MKVLHRLRLSWRLWISPTRVSPNPTILSTFVRFSTLAIPAVTASQAGRGGPSASINTRQEIAFTGKNFYRHFPTQLRERNQRPPQAIRIFTRSIRAKATNYLLVISGAPATRPSPPRLIPLHPSRPRVTVAAQTSDGHTSAALHRHHSNPAPQRCNHPSSRSRPGRCGAGGCYTRRSRAVGLAKGK